MEKITTDTIINFLKEKVESKSAQFDSNFYIEAALKLNLLMGEDQDLYFDLKQKVAQKTLELRQETKSVADAKLKIEATDDFKEMRKREAKLKRVEEFIRICKTLSRAAGGF